MCVLLCTSCKMLMAIYTLYLVVNGPERHEILTMINAYYSYYWV